jgi:hypothetical protein
VKKVNSDKIVALVEKVYPQVQFRVFRDALTLGEVPETGFFLLGSNEEIAWLNGIFHDEICQRRFISEVEKFVGEEISVSFSSGSAFSEAFEKAEKLVERRLSLPALEPVILVTRCGCSRQDFIPVSLMGWRVPLAAENCVLDVSASPFEIPQTRVFVRSGRNSLGVAIFRERGERV